MNPQMYLAIRRVVRDINPDVIQTWLPQMDLLGGCIALQFRKPWIMTERVSGKYYGEIPMWAAARRMLGRLASIVVANSQSGAEYWGPAVDPTKILVIRNAVDVERINAAQARPDDTPKRPLLLVVGRFNHQKAHNVVVRAVDKISANISVNVIMIGTGPERASIESEIDRLGLSDRITLLSYDDNWWRWLPIADGLISMSRYEGNPNVVLEAMAGGCPVILSNIPEHAEVADDSSALMVPVDDTAALAVAVAEVLADKDASLRRATTARDRVKSLTVQGMADAYDSAYRRVLKT